MSMEKLENKKLKRIIFIILIFIILLFLLVSMDFAKRFSFDQNKSSVINSINWDIHFENIKITKGSVTPIKAATIRNDTTSLNYEISLLNPGDYYEFTVDVKNSGGIKAKIGTTPMLNGVSTEQSEYVNYTVNYSDGSKIKSGDKLPIGFSAKIKVRIEYKDVKDIKDINKLPTVNQNLNLVFMIDYIQD